MHKFPGDVVFTSLLLLRDVHKTILNPKHSTVPAAKKRVNSVPAETRTVIKINRWCLSQIYISLRKNRIIVTHTMSHNTCS